MARTHMHTQSSMQAHRTHTHPHTHATAAALAAHTWPFTQHAVWTADPAHSRGGTHLEVPVDNPHLVTMEYGLQDLLDAMTAANAGRLEPWPVWAVCQGTVPSLGDMQRMRALRQETLPGRTSGDPATWR